MTKRCWIGATLTLPVLVLAMAHLIPALARQSWVDSRASRWMQFALTTPVVWWTGWTFFGLLLSPIIAGAAMSLSSVPVISNALRLRKVRL